MGKIFYETVKCKKNDETRKKMFNATNSTQRLVLMPKPALSGAVAPWKYQAKYVHDQT